MNAFAQLLTKELRLQWANVALSLLIFLLGAAGLAMVRAAADANVAGYTRADVQSGIFLAGLLPGLLVLLPVMFGSTAAAAEKSLGVLAWQAALPVPRWKVALAKVTLIVISCVVVGGLFPILLEMLLLQAKAGMLEELFRGYWPGWFAILFGMVGFYAGAYARGDYQGLLLAIVPAAAVLLSFALADPGTRVEPIGNLPPLMHPWTVIARLLFMAAVFAWLVSRRLGWLSQRRWRGFVGGLLVVFIAGYAATWANVWGDVLLLTRPARPEIVTIPAASLPPGIKSAKAQLLGRATAGDVHLMWTTRKGPLLAQLNYGYGLRSSRPDNNSYNTTLAITEGGKLQQIPNSPIAASTILVSPNGKWLLTYGSSMKFLSNVLGVTVNLNPLPERLQAWILKKLEMPYQGMLPRDVAVRRIGPDDTLLEIGDELAAIWKNGRSAIPGNATASIYNPGDDLALSQVVFGTASDESTVTALLCLVGPGEYELSGFSRGFPWATSPDGKWLNYNSGKGLVYRRPVDTWDEVLQEPQMPVLKDRGGRAVYTTRTLDSQTTFARAVMSWTIPAIPLSDEFATLEPYVVARETTATRPDRRRIEVLDFGLVAVGLESGATTQTSLMTKGFSHQEDVRPNTTDPAAALAGRLAFGGASWNQESATMAVSLGGQLFLCDFANYHGDGRPQIFMAPPGVAPLNAQDGRFLARRKYVVTTREALWLVTW